MLLTLFPLNRDNKHMGLKESKAIFISNFFLKITNKNQMLADFFSLITQKMENIRKINLTLAKIYFRIVR